MKPPEHIETERLLLRRPKPGDAPAMFTGWAQDTDVTRYLTWRPHKSIEESHRIIRLCLRSWESEEDHPYMLTLKEKDHPIGMLALHPDGFKVALGYVLAKSYWGGGYMTEASRVVVDWALEQKGIYRVFATTDVENTGSQRVLEKAGMTREGLLRRYIMHPNISDEPRDSYMYAIVK
jgi:ribosomal-protein-alanine N-acetyltransferase